MRPNIRGLGPAGQVLLGKVAVGRHDAEVEGGGAEGQHQIEHLVEVEVAAEHQTVEGGVEEEHAPGGAHADLVDAGAHHHHHRDLGDGQAPEQQGVAQQQDADAAGVARKRHQEGDHQAGEHPAEGLGGVFRQRLIAGIGAEHAVRPLICIKGIVFGSKPCPYGSFMGILLLLPYYTAEYRRNCKQNQNNL